MPSDANAALAMVTSGDLSIDKAQADLRLLQKATIAVIHKATLQDLLHYSNNAMIRILWEHNDLLRER
jgi:hypothetical protein